MSVITSQGVTCGSPHHARAQGHLVGIGSRAVRGHSVLSRSGVDVQYWYWTGISILQGCVGDI